MNKEDVGTFESGSRISKPRSRRLTARTAEARISTMKAAVMKRFGPPSVLKLQTVPVPEPGPNEVLIALYTSGVGVWDTEIRGGWWPEGKAKFPIVLGSDGAGIVAARGARVRRFNEGDRVWAYEFINPKGGFYAEYVTVNAEHVGLVPRRLDALQAGTGAVTGLTALQGIDDHLRVRAGQTVLIFGASGAVGTLAVQFAKSRGACVLGTASGKAASSLVKRLGANAVFDPRSKNSIEQLRKLMPNGIDAILALTGGDALERCIDCVRRGGRVVYPNGVVPTPKRRKIIKIQAYDAKGGQRAFEQLASAADEARLCVPVAAVYPLAQAAKAHERIKKGHVLGRIALQIRRGKK